MSAQAQPATEPPLQTHHFAVIDFVVITGQVNHPVQDQHAHSAVSRRECFRAYRRAVSGAITISPT